MLTTASHCAYREHPFEDRMSLLPDEILVCLLSFLPINEAARTSVLSKRWINLWKFISRLNFDASKVLDELAAANNRIVQKHLRTRERHKYIEWVNKVLKLNKAVTLDEFRVCFDLDKSSENEIDEWLQYAFARRVQRLELDLLENGHEIREYLTSYTFPSVPIRPSHRNFLEGSHSVSCGLHPCGFVGFNFLRALCLKCVNVSGKVLEFFLQNSPLLERLVVHGSDYLINLKVFGSSLALNYLEICHCSNMRSLKVCDTNFVSLKVCGTRKLELEKVPMLVEVYLNLCPQDEIKDHIYCLSCCLSQLEILTIHASKIEKRTELLEFPQLTRLKQLTLEAFADSDRSLIGITSLVRASPNLENFVLKLMDLWGYPVRQERKFKKGMSFPLQHLKLVELCGYYGRTSELELVMYFLANAVSLEKIIVDPRDQLMFHSPPKLDQAEKEETARRFAYAKHQLEDLIPSSVELVIL